MAEGISTITGDPLVFQTGSPSRADLEVRVRSLEAERVDMERRADQCMDDVANQIVHALSKQKVGLKRRKRCLQRSVVINFSLSLNLSWVIREGTSMCFFVSHLYIG